MFYKEIGQEKISRQKRERAESDIRDLQNQGFGERDIEFAVRWTIKNSKEKVYDFSIIKHTIGQAIAARKDTEATRLKKHEEEKLKTQQEEAEKRMAEIQEKINEHKESLNENQRLELRNKALEEIRKTKGIKEEFITEIFIESKENEIIRKQLGIEFPE